MIIGQYLLRELVMILDFNDKTGTWDTETIPMKGRDTLNTRYALIEVYLYANQPQSLVNEFFWSNKILDAENKRVVLEDVT